jgi:SAM-dependent methyltransferase
LLQRVLEQEYCNGARNHLDFACGTGRILHVAEEIFPKTTGVDVSETMVKLAREKCHRSEIIVQDITTTPLNTRYDVITAFRFFLNAEPELRKNVLKAIRKNLADNGCLIVNIHVNRTSILGRVYQLRNILLGHTVANSLGFDEFQQLLQDNQFHVKAVNWYSYWPRTGWRMEGLAKRMVPAVDELWRRVKLLPPGLAQSFMVICRPDGV